MSGGADGDAARGTAPSERRDRLLLLLFAAIALLTPLASRDLWHSDEPRYAQVARELLRGGDLVVMRLNGDVYREKPPLYFWLEAGLGKLLGDVNAVAARLPSALAAIVATLLLFALARRLARPRVALLAASLLAVTFGWWWIGQRAAFDVVMGTWVLAATLCEEVARGRQRDGDGAAALRWRLGWAACLGFGFLTKGPPVLVFGIVARLARIWAAAKGRAARDAESGPVQPAAPRALGAARQLATAGLQAVVFAAVVALWLGPLGARLGFADLLENFQKQTAGRMTENAPHAQPPWFFLTTLPVDALPWSVAWVAAAIVAWRRRAAARLAPAPTAADRDARERELDAALGRLPAGVSPREALRFALAFVLVTLVLFSCFRGKRALYLAPLQPALALLSALAIVSLRRDVAAAARGALKLARGLALAFGIGGAAALALLDRGFALGPIVAPGQSPRPLGEAVRAQLKRGDVVAGVDLRHDESVLYYADLPRIEIVDLARNAGPGDARDVTAMQNLLDLAGDRRGRLLLVTTAEKAARVEALLTAGSERLAAVSSDDVDYVVIAAH